MNWKEVESAFDWDGSWRDVYVFDVSLNDWQCLLDTLRSSNYTLRFQRELPSGVEEPVPEQVDVLFGGPEQPRPLLLTDVGGVALACHFFSSEEIEFDLDPREVSGQEQAEAVFDFMRRIGLALGKPVRLTPENLRQYVLIEYDPATDTLRKEHEFRGLL